MAWNVRRVRQPFVAGSFYARSAAGLAAQVDTLLARARRAGHGSATEAADTLGVIVPHAAYVYSGPVAATGYARLAARPLRPAFVVILGPSHFVPLEGLVVPTEEAWVTPLGGIRIDQRARRLVLEAGARAEDRAHENEHSIEVQLPFLQRIWPDVTVLPVAVGGQGQGRHADPLDALVSEGAAIIVSTDLSHYHDRSEARRLDERTAAAIEALDVEGLRPADACGYDPLRMALTWARRAGLRVRQLELSDSSDAGGDVARVVGYGAFALERPPVARPEREPCAS